MSSRLLLERSKIFKLGSLRKNRQIENCFFVDISPSLFLFNRTVFKFFKDGAAASGNAERILLEANRVSRAELSAKNSGGISDS